MRRLRDLPAPWVVALSYLAGSIPFSGVIARIMGGVDLREYGSGTVSGTGLYRVAGLRPLLAGGILDVAKGAIGPLLAGTDRPILKVISGSAAVTGHNWSVFLGGAGGRGISPAMGAMLVGAPEGSILLLGGLIVGKASRATSLGAFAAYVTLIPVLGRKHGPRGVATAAALLVPMLIKRVTGNHPPDDEARGRIYLNRLLFDQDRPRWPRWLPLGGWCLTAEPSSLRHIAPGQSDVSRADADLNTTLLREDLGE
ncbi:MAG TPA: glycerol-3-phosphate acyltransferase [Acidimicrobiia bacterium]|nr:glycerol-3-phosphate acyltransferase [Acidimicrobiia bacterium]